MAAELGEQGCHQLAWCPLPSASCLHPAVGEEHPQESPLEWLISWELLPGFLLTPFLSKGTLRQPAAAVPQV